MQNEGRKGSNFELLRLLKACARLGGLDQIRRIHEQFQNEFYSNILLGSTLVSAYGKCGCLLEANIVFSRLPNPNLVSWSALIAGYALHGQGCLALECIHNMENRGIKPDKVTFLSILKACGSIAAIQQGRCIHQQVIEYGFHHDVLVGSILIDMYGKCKRLEEANKVFYGLPSQDVVSWATMISGYLEYGEGDIALQCFEDMQQEGIVLDKVIFLSVLKACGSMINLELGRQLHELLLENRLQHEIVIRNTLVDMYAKCGQLEEARRIFDRIESRDLVSWNAMVGGYTQHSEGRLALECFEDMQHDGIEPNEVTFLSILKACASMRSMEKGRFFHEKIIQNGLHSSLVVESTLIDMYAKCESMKEARKTFDRMPTKDVVSWGAMVAGYAQLDEGYLALQCYGDMQQSGLKSQKAIYLSISKACGILGAISQGRQIHHQIIGSDLDFNISLRNALTDMYVKCGSLEEAYKVFHKVPNKDISSWGAMVTGYSQLGTAALTVECLDEMQASGVKADDLAFTGILAAFNHAGLLEEALIYFKIMKESYGIKPDMYHIACMVDLLGHKGCFSEAECLLMSTPNSDIFQWRTLLTACNAHHNVDLGIRCFHVIVGLDPLYVPAYVLISNIYASASAGGGKHM